MTGNVAIDVPVTPRPRLAWLRPGSGFPYIPAAILAEATLAYIGIGVQAPRASWGSLINDGQAVIRSLPLYVVFFLTIGFVVLFPDVVLWLPKQLLPESVGCFRSPTGTGYICP